MAISIELKEAVEVQSIDSINEEISRINDCLALAENLKKNITDKRHNILTNSIKESNIFIGCTVEDINDDSYFDDKTFHCYLRVYLKLNKDNHKNFISEMKKSQLYYIRIGNINIETTTNNDIVISGTPNDILKFFKSFKINPKKVAEYIIDLSNLYRKDLDENIRLSEKSIKEYTPLAFDKLKELALGNE
jgi:hypothetical protein